MNSSMSPTLTPNMATGGNSAQNELRHPTIETLAGSEQGHGYESDISIVAAHIVNVRTLSALVKSTPKGWFVPRKMPLELLFFRSVFNALCKREHAEQPWKHENTQEYSQISFEAFQFAMERLFYLLDDKDGFDGTEYLSDDSGFVTWTEFFNVYKKREVTVYRSFWEVVHLTFDQPESSHLAQAISNGILFAIIVSSFSFMLSTLSQCHGDGCEPLQWIESACLGLFVLEYALRASTAWAVRTHISDQARLLESVKGFEALQKESPLRRFLMFLVTPSNLIDLAAILPGAVARLTPELSGGAFVVLRLVRLTRILRAFKSPAMASAVRVISLTIKQSTQALYILAFNLMLGVVIFGSLMYMAEGGAELNAFGIGGRWNSTTQVFDRVVRQEWDTESEQWLDIYAKSPYQSIPHACWWALVTVATVGYGDSVPTTVLGKVVGVGTMLFSLIILALPVGVIGGTFGNVWETFESEKRHQESQNKRDLDFVACELSRLDPSVMSRALLIEVWDDQEGFPTPDPTRPPPALFMGEAKVQLFLHEREACVKTLTLPLEENHEISKRPVKGSITIQYAWMPEAPSTDLEIQTSARPFDMELMGKSSSSRHARQRQSLGSVSVLGTLSLTLLSADKLKNLQCSSRKKSYSNPYCMVMCYPKKSVQEGEMKPCVWRGPTVRGSLSPEFNARHFFKFKWTKQAGRSWSKHWSSDDDLSPRSINSPTSDDEAHVNHLLKAVTSLQRELSNQRADFVQMKQSVNMLEKKVEVPLPTSLSAFSEGCVSNREGLRAVAGGSEGRSESSMLSPPQHFQSWSGPS